ncbi:MAG: caspase family protein [Prochlorothrix sp.]
MGKHWAITIGINQYQFFQPLQYAQQDAEALHRFLTEQRSIPANQVILLAETAPRIGQQSTFPQRETLLAWVQWICNEQLQANDVLWVFFSGHGLCYQGEDYLMPWDGRPDRIPETGIAVRSLLHLIHGAATPKVWLMLDMNRSQGVQSSTLPGQHTSQLAQQFGIATLLSAQADQFSHETTDRRQGLFTTALLEGLQLHGCQTLGALDDYLQERLPELCDHHWKPLQRANLVGSRHFALYPSITPEPDAPVSPPASPAAPSSPIPLGHPDPTDRSIPLTATPLVLDAPSPLPSPISPRVDSAQPLRSSAPPAQSPSASSTQSPAPLDPAATSGLHPTASPAPSRPFPLLRGWSLPPWLWVMVGLGLIPLGLQAVAPQWFQAFLISPQSQSTSTLGPSPSPTPSPDLEAFYSQSLIPQINAPLPQNGSTASLSAQADTTVAQLPDTLADRSTEQLPPVPSNSTPSDSSPASSPDQSQKPLLGPFLDPSQIQAQSSDAGSAAAPSPDTDTVSAATHAPDTHPENPNQSQARLQVRNQKILQTARTLIRGNQASQFSDAIAQARQIQPGQPFYDEAQADITRWSQTIFDMAVGRAQRGDYQGAIGAVALVPRDGRLGAEAQQAITYWQELKRQKEANILLLEEAQLMLDPTSASSHSQAIALLRQIPEGEVYFFEAQRLMGEWSNAILTLAEERAAAGQYWDAIAAAELVPPGMANYAAAQAAIDRWSTP